MGRDRAGAGRGSAMAGALIVTGGSRGLGKESDLDDLVYMGNTMRDGSLCGLGQLAPRVINAMLRHFYDEFLSHIVDKTCATGACAELATGYGATDRSALRMSG